MPEAIKQGKLLSATLLLIAASTAITFATTSSLSGTLPSNEEDVFALAQLASNRYSDAETKGSTSPLSARPASIEYFNLNSQQSNLREGLQDSKTPLTGFFVTARYSDSACTIGVFAIATLLNTCIKDGDSGYSKLTATETTYYYTYYADKQCATVTSTNVVDSYSSKCASSTLMFVRTNSIPPSPTAVVSLSSYSDKSCSSTIDMITYTALDTCIRGLNSVYSVSGSVITTKVYSNVNCTGTAASSTAATLGECLADGTKWQFVSAYKSSILAPYSSSTPSDCFAGSETVYLESGEQRQISVILAGDRVLAADAAGRISFSEVVFVPHSANRDTAMFVHITTASGRDIKMTKNHLLPAGACSSTSPLPLKHASLVTVNDCVMTVAGEERVSSVGTVLAEGLYTIVTKEEFVIVNGIVASPFAYNHVAGNLYYQLHRFLYDAAPQLLSSPLVRSLNEALGFLPFLVGYSSSSPSSASFS